jgi:hypothetical protein
MEPELQISILYVIPAIVSLYACSPHERQGEGVDNHGEGGPKPKAAGTPSRERARKAEALAAAFETEKRERLLLMHARAHAQEVMRMRGMLDEVRTEAMRMREMLVDSAQAMRKRPRDAPSAATLPIHVLFDDAHPDLGRLGMIQFACTTYSVS